MERFDLMILMEAHRLDLFEKMALGMVFGPKMEE